MSPLRLVLALACLSAFVSPARAQGCPEGSVGCYESSFVQHYQQNLLPTVNFDTGYIPGGSPLQIRARLVVTGNTAVHLNGNQQVFYPPAMRIGFVGDTGGYVSIDYGFEIALWIRFDLLGIDWEGQIPIPGIPSDLRMAQSTPIDDYVLTGATPRPVLASDVTSRIRVLTYDLLSILSFLGVSGGVALDAQAMAAAMYDSTRIVAMPATSAITSEGGMSSIYPSSGNDFGGFIDTLSHAEGRLSQVGTIHVFPTVFVSLLGSDFNLDVADIPFDITSTSRSISFPPVARRVPLPNLGLDSVRLDFPSTQVGESVTQELRVRNRGTAPLVVEVIFTSTAFGLTRVGTFTINPGTSIDLAPTFAPRAAGSFAEGILLRTNDPDSVQRTVTLAGTATLPLFFDGGIDGSVSDAGVEDGGVTPSGRTAVGGCGCRVARHSGRADGLLAVLGIALVAARRARRR